MHFSPLKKDNVDQKKKIMTLYNSKRNMIKPKNLQLK